MQLSGSHLAPLDPVISLFMPFCLFEMQGGASRGSRISFMGQWRMSVPGGGLGALTLGLHENGGMDVLLATVSKRNDSRSLKPHNSIRLSFNRVSTFYLDSVISRTRKLAKYIQSKQKPGVFVRPLFLGLLPGSSDHALSLHTYLSIYLGSKVRRP